MAYLSRIRLHVLQGMKEWLTYLQHRVKPERDEIKSARISPVLNFNMSDALEGKIFCPDGMPFAPVVLVYWQDI